MRLWFSYDRPVTKAGGRPDAGAAQGKNTRVVDTAGSPGSLRSIHPKKSILQNMRRACTGPAPQRPGRLQEPETVPVSTRNIKSFRSMPRLPREDPPGIPTMPNVRDTTDEAGL